MPGTLSVPIRHTSHLTSLPDQGRLWRFASTLIENDIRMRSFVEGGRRADGEDGAVRIWTGARGIAGTGVSATTLRGGGRNNGSALPATAVPVDR